MAWLALPVTVVLIAVSSAAWPEKSLVAAQQSNLHSSAPSSLLSQVFAAQSDLVSQALCAATLYITIILCCMLRVSFIPVAVQGSWDALFEAGNISQTLQSTTDSYTVFAPVDTAIQEAIIKSDVTCQRDFYLDQQCTTLMQLLNSTSLSQLLQNHSKFR